MIIWLASYPKSGNTFLRSLLSAYLYTEDGNFELSSLNNISQFPDKNIFQKFGIDTSKDLDLVKNYLNVQKKINSNNNIIRFLKTHSSFYDINGHKFTDLNNTLGVIYIVRDPRSVVKSYANHNQMSLENATDKLLEFGTLTGEKKHLRQAEDKVITHVGSWSSNYNTWKEFKKINRYLLVKYEDLVSNTEKTFIEILNFIFILRKSQIEIDNIKLKNTLKSTTFIEMQRLEREVGFPEAIKDIDGKKITFFKYGLKNNNPNSLPETLKEKIENELKIEMQELNYI
tara:strand:- start:1853 stop:2710 length:858 start_codon:yes stop_codon:yes gene_type:complete